MYVPNVLVVFGYFGMNVNYCDSLAFPSSVTNNSRRCVLATAGGGNNCGRQQSNCPAPPQLAQSFRAWTNSNARLGHAKLLFISGQLLVHPVATLST